jgi:hypothetical protein
MKTIPLQAVPSQSLSVVLGSQNCQINVYQKSTGLFLDLFVNNEPIITAALCLDRVRLVRTSYQAFVGDLAFADTLGTADPTYQGLSTQFQLLYLESTDL